MKTLPFYVAPILLLLGLPLTGVWMAGYDASTYLEFPPRTQYVDHAPFSWPVFIGLALVILAVMLPFLLRIGRCRNAYPKGSVSRRSPWWGWFAITLGIVFWILAWTRLPWFAPFQLYTFTPLWLCYIVAINALTFRRTGRCLLTHETRFFFMLFVLSAAFWWFFEYLNRFVQNWYYIECAHFSPLQYFIAATLPFSTVLPAVLSTEEWLASHPRYSAGLEHFIPIRFANPKTAAWIILSVSATGLFFTGRFSNYLFPLLWVAPLLLLVSFQTIANRPAFFPEIKTGDWRRVFRFCLAALICGFFWEIWNYLSLAKWIYTVPYVHRFQLFEMPILGYAGYLPFGLECAVIGELLRKGKRHG
jgi:hypothetical protein